MFYKSLLALVLICVLSTQTIKAQQSTVCGTVYKTVYSKYNPATKEYDHKSTSYVKAPICWYDDKLVIDGEFKTFIVDHNVSSYVDGDEPVTIHLGMDTDGTKCMIVVRFKGDGVVKFTYLYDKQGILEYSCTFNY